MPTPKKSAPAGEVRRPKNTLSKKLARQRLLGDLISPKLRTTLASRRWPLEVLRELDLMIKVPVYFEDPLVAKEIPELGPNMIEIAWEPGLADGPTSSRLAVVDYDGDAKRLEQPAHWVEEKRCFVNNPTAKKPLTSEHRNPHQFHQMNVWATVQRVLDFYEDATVLGRPVPWAFRGNRLIIVPHAGEGQNACYDPTSKSLQFYYFGEANRVYTCLSHDIVAHEAGHAVLDGIRPYFLDSFGLETAALHEFVADITAILSSLRNNDVRSFFIQSLEGKKPANFLENLAEQFGEAVENRPYLRTANNKFTMDDMPGRECHECSQILTGMVFDILLGLLESYWHERKRSAKQAAWDATQRITRLALQPLNYFPPVDAKFSDYAQAMLHRDYLLNPDDPYKYRSIIRQVCNTRKIPVPQDDKPIEAPYNLSYPPVNDLLASHTAAYHYLHANRKALRIPNRQDVVIVDVSAAERVGRDYFHLPREVIMQYLWAEDVTLDGREFGPLQGMAVPLLCGGTVVFDENSNFLYWARKPGTEEEKDQAEGRQRKQELLAHVADRVAAGDAEVYKRLTSGRFTTQSSLTESTLAQRLGLSNSSRLGD
jgi:hypothetical protein